MPIQCVKPQMKSNQIKSIEKHTSGNIYHMINMITVVQDHYPVKRFFNTLYCLDICIA